VLAQVVRAVGISADTLLGLNQLPGTQETTTSGESSFQRIMDRKDIVIVQQGETIEAMTYALKMLS
jgi:hypothetical protein